MSCENKGGHCVKKDTIKEYCTGCGLCNSIFNTKFIIDGDGFPKPDIKSQEMLAFCEKVCPVNGNHLLKQTTDNWGSYVNVYEGYSLDETIRYKAASGGITTAIAVFLLETGKVDGIIQIGEGDTQFQTKVYCSRTREEIILHSASRYITSSPLSDFLNIISAGGRYAFIGRPCDAIVLRNFLELMPQYKENIFCILSFFCAGTPSETASRKLSLELGIEPSTVKHIQYRGNGWPGKATVESIDGKKKTMEYIDSWNKILGRDILKICKFCTDGVGEAADISSGDLWYLNDRKQPVFDEQAGRNVVFSRSNKGDKLIMEAIQHGYIRVTSYETQISELDYVQPNHAVRKKLLYAKYLAMKIMRRSSPEYDVKMLKKFAKERSVKENIRTFMGAVKRILEGKL